MSKSKILVTGADGFIGSHLTEALVKRGYSVSAFVQYNSIGSWGWLDSLSSDVKNKINVISGDIRDFQCVNYAVENCDTVIHLAALIAIPYSYKAPGSYIDTNVHGTLNLLQAAKNFGVRKFIHTSTSEVYGSAQFVPITETHPLSAQSPYSASKISADMFAYSFFTTFNLPVVTIRPFNTYGPRQSARAVIPTVITQLLSGRSKIKLGAISPTRDFSYIDDTVSAFICAVENKVPFGEVFNLGSNFEISIGDVARKIAQLMNVQLDIITDEERFRPQLSEVNRLWADNSKAIKYLGWKPKYASIDGIDNGLSKTIEWFRKEENFLKYRPYTYSI